MSDSSEISSGLEAGLRMETRELQMAIYILSEEVVDMLKDGTFTVVEELSPVYNADKNGRRFGSNDPYFDSDTVVQKKNGETFKLNEAYNVFTEFTLREKITNKDLLVQYNIFNSAYFPFNTGKRDKNNIQKNSEVQRTSEFLGKEESFSAFDVKIKGEATRESLSVYFDSYQYVFRKVVNENGYEYVELEILQWDEEENKKVLRKSNKLGGINTTHFDLLRNMAFKCLKRSK